jgi:hypothetical protein
VLQSVTQVLPGHPCLPADTWHHVSIVVVELRMAVHFRPTDPLPAPAPLIPDPAGACISLNAKRCVDDWWRPLEQSKLGLLGDGSSGVLSLLVESLPPYPAVRQEGIHNLLTWPIGAFPTPQAIRSHVRDGFQCQPLLGHVTRFQGSFEV